MIVMENKIVYSQLQEVKLQNDAIQFVSQIKLILNGAVITPKEIEVYYYKEGEFSDESVHRNELQQNNMNHFYVHRNGKTKIDRYKGGNRAGIDFVVSNERGVYYSYLIRSAVVNDKIYYGPHIVLEAIRFSSNLDYKGIEDNAVVVEINDNSYDVILSQRINLGKGFVESKLRAVVLDNDFINSKYRDKEVLIIEKIRKDNLSKEKALFFAKKNLGYIPSVIRNL